MWLSSRLGVGTPCWLLDLESQRVGGCRAGLDRIDGVDGCRTLMLLDRIDGCRLLSRWERVNSRISLMRLEGIDGLRLGAGPDGLLTVAYPCCGWGGWTALGGRVRPKRRRGRMGLDCWGGPTGGTRAEPTGLTAAGATDWFGAEPTGLTVECCSTGRCCCSRWSPSFEFDASSVDH